MWETMCNPIVQAMIINKSKVDMAIMLGLCIGHDTLLIKYCEVPLMVLAVKDRVTGHNPLAALYTSGTYYSRLKNRILMYFVVQGYSQEMKRRWKTWPGILSELPFPRTE